MMGPRLAVLLGLTLLPAWQAGAQQRPTQPAPGPAAAAQTVPAPAAPAGTPPERTTPERTTATYGDWTTRCEAQATGGGALAKACEASHAVIDARGQTVAQIVIGRAQTGGALLAVVQVPVNATVAEPARLRLDAASAPLVILPFRACAPRGCFAQAVLAPQELGRLRQRAEPVQIEYRDAAATAVLLPIPLRGLGPALDALDQEAR